MDVIGFIGLGNMGGPMAVNLVNAGFTVKGFDLVEAAIESAEKNGVKVCGSAIEAVTDADVIITMLPNGDVTLRVYEEILPALDKSSVLIDCSTIDISSAKKAHELAEKSGVKSLDAPVSGGVGGAVSGTLTFMVGGESNILSQTQNVFEVMGSKTVHCGDAGAGQAAKICNNMLLAISMIGSCEVFNLAEKLDLDREALFDVISTSSGQCWSVNTYCPVPNVGPGSPADNDYKPGFAAALMLKDLMLGRQAAEEVGAATPLGKHATELYQAYIDGGNGNMDFSGIMKHLSEIED